MKVGGLIGCLGIYWSSRADIIYEKAKMHHLVLPRFVLLVTPPGDKALHLICPAPMHGGGGLGVGIQSDSNGVVAQDAEHHLSTHAIFDRQRRVGVVHIAEADISLMSASLRQIPWSRPAQLGPYICPMTEDGNRTGTNESH